MQRRLLMTDADPAEPLPLSGWCAIRRAETREMHRHLVRTYAGSCLDTNRPWCLPCLLRRITGQERLDRAARVADIKAFLAEHLDAIPRIQRNLDGTYGPSTQSQEGDLHNDPVV